MFLHRYLSLSSRQAQPLVYCKEFTLILTVSRDSYWGVSMRSFFNSESIKLAFGRWWRKYIVDECPDAREERIRQERIENIKICADLQEAMRLWELRHQKWQENGFRPAKTWGRR